MTRDTIPSDSPVTQSNILSADGRDCFHLRWQPSSSAEECTVTLIALGEDGARLGVQTVMLSRGESQRLNISGLDPLDTPRFATFLFSDDPNDLEGAVLWANIPLDRSEFFKGQVATVRSLGEGDDDDDLTPDAFHIPESLGRPEDRLPGMRVDNTPWATLAPAGAAARPGIGSDKV